MVDVLYQPVRGACGSPAEALAEMDAAGVAVAMVSQCKRWSCERQHLCVDTRLEDVARFAGASSRFAALAGYNPFDVTESVREIEAARALGFRGTYLHLPSFALRLNDPRLYPLFSKSSELQLPAIVEVPFAEPELARSLERIGNAFPDLALAVVYPRLSLELFLVCQRFDGLAYVLDTAALTWLTAHQPALLEDAAIHERCLWGSNGAPLSATTMEVMELELPLETLEKIARTNALRFFAAPSAARNAQALSNEVTSAER